VAPKYFVSVCLSVRGDISGTTRAILINFCACCLLLWFSPPMGRRCDMLRTSGFVDDIMFFIIGRIAV